MPASRTAKSSPSDRLEARKQLAECRVCAFLATIDEDLRREWVKALANVRFTNVAIADEMKRDGADVVGEESVGKHRRRMHR